MPPGSDHSDSLWHEVDDLFKGRPGWGVQAMSTPGAPPAWVLKTADEADLWVTVDAGLICVYLIASEQDVRLGTTEELVAWLGSHRPGSLPDRRTKAVDKARRGKLFEWG